MQIVKINKKNKKEFINFLNESDNLFPIPLHEKVIIDEYANKLLDKAIILAIYSRKKIIASICGYINANKESYASMLCVLPDFQNKGYAKSLVIKFLDLAKEKNSTLVHLYAVKDNTKAINLYNGLGFEEYKIENEARTKDVHLFYNFRNNEPNNYLITSIGSFSADITIKRLKSVGGGLIVGTDIYNKEWIADSYNVDYFYQVPRVSEEEKYTKTIKRIIKKHNIKYIVPLTDVDVDYFNKNRNIFNNVTICISSNETLSICRNKYKIKEFIDKNIEGINTIPTYFVNELKSNIKPPLIAKIINGRSSQGLIKIYSNKELKQFLDNKDNKNYIIQPLIDGNVVTVDVICDGENAVAIAREELLRTLNGAGTSVKVYHNRKLENDCKKLALALNIKGCVNFEFIKNGNKYYFIECNPRFSGGLEFSCIAGYDCVTNHINCFKNKRIKKFDLNKTIYIARKYEEYVTKEI